MIFRIQHSVLQSHNQALFQTERTKKLDFLLHGVHRISRIKALTRKKEPLSMRLITSLITSLALTSSAYATNLSIGYEQPLLGPGITPVLNVANPVNGFVSINFTVGNFLIETSFHAGSTIDLTGTVKVTAINPAIADWISIYLSENDITAPTGPVTIRNTMTVTMPDGWWLDRTAYIDDAAQQDGGNGVFSLTTYLQPPLIYNHGGTEVFNSPYDVPPGLYSLTQFYSVQSTPVAVPGPIAGAGLPGLLMLGLFLWRRHTMKGVNQ